MKRKNNNKVVILIILLLFVTILGVSSSFKNDGLKTENQIALIPIKGIIGSVSSSIPFSSSQDNTELILNALEKSKENKNIKAVILEINSPGGTVIASKEIANAVKNLDKPVISLIREVGASGAYWVASSSDYIIADELSITGSIGVISSYLQFSGLLENYNITYERLIAGQFKDIGSPFKELTNEERIILQKKLDKIQEVFVNEVKENRNLDNTEEIEKGLFYLGSEALELGLVDELGNKDLAIKKAKELANIKDARIVEYKEKKNLLDILSRLSTESFYYMGLGISSNFNLQEDKFEILAK